MSSLCPFCKRAMSLVELVRVDPPDNNPEVWRCRHCKILVRMIGGKVEDRNLSEVRS